MSTRALPPFYPEKILWRGACVLLGSGLVAASYLWFLLQLSPLVDWVGTEKKQGASLQKELSFSFGIGDRCIEHPVPEIEPDLFFSVDPPHPHNRMERSIFARCRQSAQAKRISLPCRLDLQYLDGGRLGFSEEISPFWADLTQTSTGQIEAVVRVSWRDSSKELETQRFVKNLQEIPVREAREFGERTPFRLLAEARFLGPDVFAERYVGGAVYQQLAVEGGFQHQLQP